MTTAHSCVYYSVTHDATCSPVKAKNVLLVCFKIMSFVKSPSYENNFFAFLLYRWQINVLTLELVVLTVNFIYDLTTDEIFSFLNEAKL